MEHLTYLYCFEKITVENSSNLTEGCSRKDVNFKFIEKKTNYIPIRLFLDISLEFTLIPYEIGLLLNLKRLPDDKIHKINTRFGKYLGIYKTIEFIETTDLNRCLRRYTKIPFLWIMPFGNDNTLDFPLLGKRGFYPANLVQIGGNTKMKILHPLYFNLLPLHNPNISVKIYQNGTLILEGNLIIDTFQSNSLLIPSMKKHIQNFSFSFEKEENGYFIEYNEKIDDNEVIGILGWDFLDKNSVIFNQGHLLQKDNMRNAPFKTVPKEISLQHRISEEIFPNYPDSILNDFYFHTKTYFNMNDSQTKVEIFQNKVEEQIFCEIKKSDISIALLNESQLSNLNCDENQQNCLDIKISNFMLKNLEFKVIKTRFPYLLISNTEFTKHLMKEYSKFPHLRILANSKDVFKFPFNVKIGFMVKSDEIFIPFDIDKVQIEISPLIFNILNFKGKSTCYISSKRVKFVNGNENLFKSVPFTVSEQKDSFVIQISKRKL
eukprot:gene425-6838_t